MVKKEATKQKEEDRAYTKLNKLGFRVEMSEGYIPIDQRRYEVLVKDVTQFKGNFIGFLEFAKSKNDFKKQGKVNRAAGKAFETKVRKHLESTGWIVDKWTNNVNIISVDPEDGISAKLVPCKPKFNPFTKAMMMNSGGFPDFIATKLAISNSTMPDDSMLLISESGSVGVYESKLYYIIGVESKVNGILKPEEKQKCQWYLENKIFSKILIAKKSVKRGEIVYTEFKNE